MQSRRFLAITDHHHAPQSHRSLPPLAAAQARWSCAYVRGASKPGRSRSTPGSTRFAAGPGQPQGNAQRAPGKRGSRSARDHRGQTGGIHQRRNCGACQLFCTHGRTTVAPRARIVATGGPAMASRMKILLTANSVTHWQQIEPICVAFEEEWRQGRRPSLDDYLGLGADLPKPLLQEELLRIELFYRRGAGETPDINEYRARFPDSPALVEQVFAAEPRLPSRADFAPQAIVERYKIIEELGRGSFAVVYLACDQELGRSVAIKIPGDGHQASAQQLSRLLEEARAAARLHHPGIVAIYDVQPLADGGVFAVLEYVAGVTL